MCLIKKCVHFIRCLRESGGVHLWVFGMVVYLNPMVLSAQDTTSLKSYLERINQTESVTIFFKEAWVDTIMFTVDPEKDYLANIQSAIAKSGFNYYEHQGTYVFIYPNKIEFERRLNAQNTVDLDAADFIRIGDPSNSDESETYTLKGYISDESNVPLVGVNISVNDELMSRTGIQGDYILNLKPGNYLVEYSYVGSELERRFITLYSSGGLNISMFEDSQLLDEVTIVASSFNETKGIAQVGVQTISSARLEKLPSFLGDVDVVKSATALPGVTVSGESSSYLNVRGGRNDQTLVLMNNTSIYNPGHLLGFFSVFNGDFVSEMTLYKGNIPARYGARASSVLDVKMNQWATKPLNVTGGIGIANSNIGIKTKLLEDKLDIHVGGRLSYTDWLLDLIPDEDIVSSSIRFGDFNFNSKYALNGRNTITASTYYGKDFFNYSNDIIYRWSTWNNQLKWSHLFMNDWVFESELLMSRLNNSSEGLEVNDEFMLENGIHEYTFKSSMSNEHWEFGLDVADYAISAGEIQPTSPNSLVQTQAIDQERLLNLVGYSSYLFAFENGLEINPGIRVSYLMNLGPGSVNLYQDDQPFERDRIIGQEMVEPGDPISSNWLIEPRLGINYKKGDHTFRAGYSRIEQFLHLISNTVLINPSTVWKGTDRYVPTTKIDQLSLGYQRDFSSADWSVSIDGFYKQMNDLLEYRDGATLVLNENLEQEILRGEGQSYGFEFLMSKRTGTFTGFMSYTYSRSFITVNDQMQNIQINDGEKYPFYSDRPHSIKSSIDYKLTKKWTLSSNFTFISGAPISAPLTRYVIEGKSIPFYSNRNAERIPNYHRLDLVLTLKSRIRKTKKNNDRWVLTLYNVYGRDNVATIFFSNKNDLPGQSFKLINVGRMIPTLTYKFEF